ncbi:MAG: rhomboid family intramembrane serine protease [Thermoprotei archaeon]
MSFNYRFTLSKPGKNLIIAIIAGLVIGAILNSLNVLELFVQINYLVERGWLVPLVTSIIVVPPITLGIVDVAFNAIAVYFLDPLLSSVYNDRQYYAVFLITAVFGNVLSLLNGPGVESFGASGGIFGLIAGALAFDYAYNRRLNPAFLGWFLFVFLYSSFGIVYSSFGRADVLAHTGGSLMGLPLGYFLGSKKRRRELGAYTWRYGYP